MHLFGVRRLVAAFKNIDLSMFCKVLDKLSTTKAATSRRTPKIFTTTLLASLGAGLEYYDFIIYGLMANTLSQIFFSQDSSVISLAKTFAIFAVGYLARPIGGIFFGLIGDVWGRKKALLNVMFLMAFSTFCIGLLPTQWGNVSAISLLALRCLQGISFGAELPGAITYINESSTTHRKSFFSGWLISSVTLGSILASLVMYLLSNYFSHDEILTWAWRIPFILGGVLALVNFFIRKYLKETSEFLQLERKDTHFKTPLIKLIREYRLEMLLGVGITSLAACLVIFFLYLPTFLGKNYPASDLFASITLSLLWSVIAVPLSGLIADRIGYGKLFLISCVLIALFAIPLFYLFSLKTFSALLCSMIIYQTILSLLSGSYLVLLSDLFPTEVRYTGVAICYNLAYALMGFLPMVLTSFPNPLFLGASCLIFFGLCAACCFIVIRAKQFLKRKDADIVDPQLPLGHNRSY